MDYENGGQGGGIYIIRSNPLLINNTIARNSTQNQFYPGEGGGIWIEIEPFPTILNCILWENSSSSFSMDLHFPYLDKRLDFSYSLIEDGLGDVGVLKPWTLVHDPPAFRDPDNEEYHLKDISPCRDAGDPDTLGLDLPATDLSGNQRLIGERIDMGAYEYIYALGEERTLKDNPPLELYPNPNSGLLRFQFPGTVFEGPFLMRITDLQGKIRSEYRYDVLPDVLKLEKLQEGIYIISIEDSAGQIFKGKFIRD